MYIRQPCFCVLFAMYDKKSLQFWRSDSVTKLSKYLYVWRHFARRQHNIIVGHFLITRISRKTPELRGTVAQLGKCGVNSWKDTNKCGHHYASLKDIKISRTSFISHVHNSHKQDARKDGGEFGHKWESGFGWLLSAL